MQTFRRHLIVALLVVSFWSLLALLDVRLSVVAVAPFLAGFALCLPLAAALAGFFWAGRLLFPAWHPVLSLLTRALLAFAMATLCSWAAMVLASRLFHLLGGHIEL